MYLKPLLLLEKLHRQHCKTNAKQTRFYTGFVRDSCALAARLRMSPTTLEVGVPEVMATRPHLAWCAIGEEVYL